MRGKLRADGGGGSVGVAMVGSPLEQGNGTGVSSRGRSVSSLRIKSSSFYNSYISFLNRRVHYPLADTLLHGIAIDTIVRDP